MFSCKKIEKPEFYTASAKSMEKTVGNCPLPPLVGMPTVLALNLKMTCPLGYYRFQCNFWYNGLSDTH